MEDIETHVDSDRQMSDVEETSPSVTDCMFADSCQNKSYAFIGRYTAFCISICNCVRLLTLTYLLHTCRDCKLYDIVTIADEAFANKILPNLGYEVEDFKWHTWQVAGWKALDKRITGPEFEAGGWKWYDCLKRYNTDVTI